MTVYVCLERNDIVGVYADEPGTVINIYDAERKTTRVLTAEPPAHIAADIGEEAAATLLPEGTA